MTKTKGWLWTGIKTKGREEGRVHGRPTPWPYGVLGLGYRELTTICLTLRLGTGIPSQGRRRCLVKNTPDNRCGRLKEVRWMKDYRTEVVREWTVQVDKEVSCSWESNRRSVTSMSRLLSTDTIRKVETSFSSLIKFFTILQTYPGVFDWFTSVTKWRMGEWNGTVLKSVLREEGCPGT